MEEKNINAQTEESKNSEVESETTVNDEGTQNETKKEETVGEVFEEKKVVPESVLIKYKKELKEQKRLNSELLEKLTKINESDSTEKEMSDDVKSLADEYNIDDKFLKKMFNTIKKETEESLKSELASKLKPFEEKEKVEKSKKIFEEHYNKTLEMMPEFKDIANKEVIRTLALDPRNKDKTFIQLFEESYGHLIKGKRTLDASKPRGGNEESEIDYARAKQDTSYFKSIMDNPELKKKYNSNLEKRLGL